MIATSRLLTVKCKQQQTHITPSYTTRTASVTWQVQHHNKRTSKTLIWPHTIHHRSGVFRRAQITCPGLPIVKIYKVQLPHNIMPVHQDPAKTKNQGQRSKIGGMPGAIHYLAGQELEAGRQNQMWIRCPPAKLKRGTDVDPAPADFIPASMRYKMNHHRRPPCHAMPTMRQKDY